MDRREEVLYEIFLDPLKAYEALDQDRCPEIPATYRVGPRALQIIWVYWYQLTMVDKARGYYASPFKGYHGVTQRDPLYPMIFNMILEYTIRHWVTVVAAMEAGVEVLGALVQDLAAYFYSDDGLVASTQPMSL